MRYVYDEKTQTFADLDADLADLGARFSPDFGNARGRRFVAAGETVHPVADGHYAVALEAGVSLTVNFLSRANRHRVLEKAVAFANRRDACDAFCSARRAPRLRQPARVHGGSIRDGGRRDAWASAASCGEDAPGEAGEAQGGGGGRG